MALSVTSTARTPLVVDTDMAGDDWLAILFLLANQDKVDIKAITVCGTGQAYPEPAGSNALKLLDMMDAPNTPVATGGEKAFSGENSFPESLRITSSGMQGIDLPSSKRSLQGSGSAPDLIVQTLIGSNRPVTILALGPWTNIAHALRINPNIAKNIERIVAMGGAVNVPGNIHIQPEGKLSNNTAEWNFYLDPASVHIVMGFDIPIDLVPLDATNQVPANDQLIAELRSKNSLAADFSATVLSGWKQPDGSHIHSLWDVLAAVALVHPDVVEFEPTRLSIDISQTSETEGALRIDSNNGRHVRFANYANKALFESMFVASLTRSPSN